MPFDGFVTKSIEINLNNQIKEAKINNIYQHNRFDLSVLLRSHRKNVTLFISTHPSFCRVHLTDKKYENPDHPPSFCMLLRKYLKGGTIKNITQYQGDRILDFDITHQDEFGLQKELLLTVEIMGKHSNVILVNKKNKRILDGIKRIEREFSTKREILPGVLFERPPGQDKSNPWKDNFFITTPRENMNVNDLLFNYLQGVSPVLSKELAYRSGVLGVKTAELTTEQHEKLQNQLHILKNKIHTNTINPVIFKDIKKDVAIDFYLFPLQHISLHGNNSLVKYFKTNNGLMETIDEYYQLRESEDKKNLLNNELNKKINQVLKKSKKKLKKQLKEFEESENAEEYKIIGELLTANLYQFKSEKPVESKIEVTDYYKKPPENITINLDKSLSPSGNAQRYFKKYQKAKIRNRKLKKEINKTRKEIEYLESINYQLENSQNLDEFETIKEELIKEGYIKKAKRDKIKSKKAAAISKPMEFVSEDGYKILVGKNNKQNDLLTTKEASSEDIWLHTKEIAGSHVVIRGRNIPFSTLKEAASIAAYYSKGRNSSNVPVDYTKVKFVRKPKGAKPGMVIYENHNTLFVNPIKPSD